MLTRATEVTWVDFVLESHHVPAQLIEFFKHAAFLKLEPKRLQEE